MNGGLARQFTSSVIWLLPGASALSASLGELVALGPVTVIEMSKLVRRWFTRGTSA